MKIRYCLVTASLALLWGCGGGFKGNLPQSPSYQSVSPPKSEALICEESVKFDVPVQVNKQVKAYLVYFSTERKKIIQRQLVRSSQYLPMIRGIFREYGLPEDLAYLAMVESGFNPEARSSAGAYGMWQFIKGTGRRYGLVINNHVDERRDPEKSTRAAARYLRDLYKRFGSWYLAAASYNCGERRVEKELNKGNNQNFWQLSANKCLPTETKNYVPQMIAAIIIAKNPEKFGFTNVPVHQPLHQDDLEMTEPSRNLARKSGPAMAPGPQPGARSQALSSHRLENQALAHTSDAPKPRPPAQASVQSSQKQSPHVADAETKDSSAPHTASLVGSSHADPPPKGITGKKAGSKKLATGTKKKKTTQVKAGKGKKKSPPLLAKRSKTPKSTRATVSKKKNSPSPSNKGKLAKPKSKELLVSEAR
jgi:hypothetical protein